MGGRVMFEAMRYRPATPQESPATVAARKKAKQEREALERALAQECPLSDPASPPPTPSSVMLAPLPRIVLASSSGSTEGGEPFGEAMQGYDVPGRNPDSQMPWEFFLGNAAHRLIAYMYGVRHPGNRIFYNSKTIIEIVKSGKLGDESSLLPSERSLRPDIVDISMRIVFEIKPWNDQGLQQGRQELQIYLTALNRSLSRGEPFLGGTGFDGETLIRFARGQYIWRLEWQTTEPGIVQYRWTRSQQRFDSAREAHEAGQWVNISEQEMQQYGGWVGQAVEGMVSRREQLATFSGAVGACIDIIGGVAVSIISSSLVSGGGTKHTPAQGGGRVISFPVKTLPPAPPVKVPAASGQ
jgi:hypothetical protein